MTDIEHAKKYAEESISLAISMYNPKAEIIAETACLYGLTYKNEQLTKAKELLLELYDCIPASMADSCRETLQKVALFFRDEE